MVKAMAGFEALAGAGRSVDDCAIGTWLFADPAAAQEFAARHDVVTTYDFVATTIARLLCGFGA